MTQEDADQFSIYVIRHGDLCLLATCGSAEALGVALVTLHDEDEFVGNRVGVKSDSEWIVNPYGANQKKEYYS